MPASYGDGIPKAVLRGVATLPADPLMHHVSPPDVRLVLKNDPLCGKIAVAVRKEASS